MSLEKELEGVTAPDVESPDDVTTDDQLEDELEGGAGGEDDASGDDDDLEEEGGEKKSRSPENVRRELLRKQSESEQKLMNFFNQQFNQLSNLVQTMVGGKSDGQKPGAVDINSMSSDQLMGLRDQVPEEKRAEFDALVIEKKVDEKIATRFSQHQEEEKYKKERTRANQLAVERFPQLLDGTSALALEVDRRLRSMDNNYKRYNTRIVLNTAEDVASELGLKPRHTERARRLTRPASIDATKPTKPGSSNKSTTNLATIAKNLSGGKIKFDAAAMKRIEERSKLYENLGDKE